MKIEKREIEEFDLLQFPVWRFDPELEVYRPLIDLDENIGSVDEIHFRAKFLTPQGKLLFGSVTGLGDTAIGILRNGRWYAANKNWKETSRDQLLQLIKDSPDLDVSSVDDLLPLRFETQINTDPFIDRSGHFSLD